MCIRDRCNSDVMCVNSALVYDQDCDFGDVAVVEPNDLSTFSRKNELLPSEKIDREMLSHLIVVFLAYLQQHTDSTFMCTRLLSQIQDQHKSSSVKQCNSES